MIMSPSIYNLLSGYQRMKLNRLKRVMVEGSPKYHYDLAVMAAGVYVEFDIARYFPKAKKYEPLDTCLIINNDAVDIGMNFNGHGGDLYIIPAGTIRKITREEEPAIWQVRITNLDAAVATVADKVDFDFWRSPEDADSIARAGIK